MFPQMLLGNTIAGPVPSTAYAMLTPSLVFAYWMRGSISAIFYREVADVDLGSRRCWAQHLAVAKGRAPNAG
jgi:hypothetical protein